MRSPPHPLYPPPELTPDRVAMLIGPVATVDGVNVPPKASFALLPGCHVVVLQSKIGEGNQAAAWSADLKHATYVFQMKAGHSYAIEVHLLSGSSQSVGNANVGGVKLTAVERDPSGHIVGTIAPARRKAEIQACQPDAQP